ncbi:MAG: glycosyltransferase, partial [Flavobacteriaceae bacterium]|nr:glycosyltransferase [Flavobacteriaceae bacterium]
MNVCIATSNYTPDKGGIATYSRRLAKILAVAGHSVIILTIDLTTEVIEPDSLEKIENNILLIRLKKSFRTKYIYYKKYFKEGSIDAPYWIATGLAMQEWITNNYNSYNIDIIEASAYGGIGVFLIGKQFPPVLLSGHGTFFQYKRINKNKENEQTKLIEKLELLAFHRADGIISHSPLSKKDIEKYTTIKVHLARIAFFPEYNTLIDKDTKLFSGKKYALVVG